jgi:hypothetical protein
VAGSEVACCCLAVVSTSSFEVVTDYDPDVFISQSNLTLIYKIKI